VDKRKAALLGRLFLGENMLTTEQTTFLQQATVSEKTAGHIWPANSSQAKTTSFWKERA
jgi:hypothetical protein